MSDYHTDTDLPLLAPKNKRRFEAKAVAVAKEQDERKPEMKTTSITTHADGREEHSDDGECGCQKEFGNCVYHVGWDHYAVCEQHKVYWWLGSNLFSAPQTTLERLGKEAAEAEWVQTLADLEENYTRIESPEPAVAESDIRCNKSYAETLRGKIASATTRLQAVELSISLQRAVLAWDEVTQSADASKNEELQTVRQSLIAARDGMTSYVAELDDIPF